MKEGLKILPIFVGVILLSSCDFNFDTNFSNMLSSLEDNYSSEISSLMESGIAQSSSESSIKTDENSFSFENSQYVFEEDPMMRNAYFDFTVYENSLDLSLGFTDLMNVLSLFGSQYGFAYNYQTGSMARFSPSSSLLDIYTYSPCNFYINDLAYQESSNTNGTYTQSKNISNTDYLYYLSNFNEQKMYMNARYVYSAETEFMQDDVKEHYMTYDENEINGYNVVTNLLTSEKYCEDLHYLVTEPQESLLTEMEYQAIELFYELYESFVNHYYLLFNNDYTMYDFHYVTKKSSSNNCYYLHYKYCIDYENGNQLQREETSATMCFVDYEILSLEKISYYEDLTYQDINDKNVYNVKTTTNKKHFNQTGEQFNVPTYIE